MLRHAIPDIELRTRLADRGFECHLLAEELGSHPSFASKLRAELGPLLRAAYDREATDEHFQYETWAVTISPLTGPPIACATLSFYDDIPSYFRTHFEAVHPSLQRQGVGRLLYECLAVWTRFLVFSDVLVREGVVHSDGGYCLVSCVDLDKDEDRDAWETARDNRQGHGAFLRKLGFIAAQHDFRQRDDEIAFQRAFHVPVERDDEEAPTPP